MFQRIQFALASFGHCFDLFPRHFRIRLVLFPVFKKRSFASTHTTIAFAMAATLFLLFTKQKFVKYGAILYAICIGLGVSISIHWFSDFVAGAIIGTIIGTVVGKSFRNRYLLNKPEKNN